MMEAEIEIVIYPAAPGVAGSSEGGDSPRFFLAAHADS